MGETEMLSLMGNYWVVRGCILLGLIFAILFGIYVLFKVRANRRRIRHIKTGQPAPGPDPTFIIGIDPFEYKPTHIHIRLLEYCKKYGDVFSFFITTRPYLVVIDPEAIQHVMRSKSFYKRMYPPLFDRYLKGKGILFTNNMPIWKVMRAASLQGMMKPVHLKKVASWAGEITNVLLKQWNAEFPSQQPFEVDIDGWMTKLTLDVIGKAAFSVDINAIQDPDSHLGQVIHKVMVSSNKYIHIPPEIFQFYEPSILKEGSAAAEYLRQLVRDIIRQRKQNSEEQNEDLLGILLDYRDENDKPLDEEEIVYACWDLFLAGHETTAHTLSWLFMYLAQNPQQQQLVQQEVDQVLSGERPTYENSSKLNFCQSVFKETLRLKPTVPIFSRLSDESEQVNGYHLPPQTPVLIFPAGLHRHPKLWKDPESFNPGRWEELDNKKEEFLPYFPFGWGHRQCIGMRMSFLEAKVVLAMIMQRYTVSIDPSITLEEEATITLRPVGLKLIMTPRLET